ncbi:hypothetical protein DSO57_1028325 [Entomophthora muscae]|uniref:Uncharacterized protein n=1 Tax=Entomophthora muscae TaxID=34485 RepID=A0ACC2SQH5_9FUNG|nr:hypothetical protein DSO57_1028325 [Entomophthora muscae]
MPCTFRTSANQMQMNWVERIGSKAVTSADPLLLDKGHMKKGGTSRKIYYTDDPNLLTISYDQTSSDQLEGSNLICSLSLSLYKQHTQEKKVMSQLCFLLSILCTSVYCSTSGDYNNIFNRWDMNDQEEEDRDPEINYGKIDWANSSPTSDHAEQIPFTTPNYTQIHNPEPIE